MKSRWLCLVFLSLSLFLVGCEAVPHYNRVQSVSFVGAPPRKAYGTVRVFQTAEEVKRKFEVVGQLSCEASAGDEAAILKAMLYRAADMGGDGLLLNIPRNSAEVLTDPSTTRVDVRMGWAAMIGNGNNRAYRAQVIRFIE